MDNKLKYLEKYTQHKTIQPKRKPNKTNVFLMDEDFNEQANLQSKVDRTESKPTFEDQKIWQEINDEENEDELKAISTANRNIENSNEPLLLNKRQRHDSDSEEEFNSNINKKDDLEIEKELDELIKDDDGDILLNPKKGGLILDLKNTVEKKRKIDERILNKEKNKQKQETVYRDELGRKVDKAETKEHKKKELEKINKERLDEWGNGVVQKQEAIQMRNEMIKNKEEPFSRYNIDSQVDEEYKKVNRFEDPMKGILTLHKYEKGIDTSSSISRGFYLPKCKFVGPPNRFGINPGYRWDGVNRSNGFEIRYLQSINKKIDQEQEYHKIRTEEM